MSAHCSLIQRFHYGEPMLAALYREMGRLTMQSRSTKRQTTATGEAGLAMHAFLA
jgi:hypothetical protein